jgi:hypothetical protein
MIASPGQLLAKISPNMTDAFWRLSGKYSLSECHTSRHPGETGIPLPKQPAILDSGFPK